MTSTKSFPTTLIVLIATAGAITACVCGIWAAGWTAEGTVRAARYTARFSFYWFVAAWSAGAMSRLWPGGWRALLMKRRRAVGLGFAAAHVVHLIALVTAIVWFGHASGIAQIIGGGIGYLFVAAMAATSNDSAMRLLGARRWKLLHGTGGWILCTIFALSYGKSLATKPFWAIPALLLLLAAVTMRGVVALQSRRQRPAQRLAT